MAEESSPMAPQPAVDLQALREFVEKRPYDVLNGIPAPAEIADEESCAEILRQARWSDGLACPGCGGGPATVRETGVHGVLKLYHCGRCGAAFNDRSGTIFSLRGGSDWPLTYWFYGIWLIAHGLSKREIWPLWGMHYGTADLIAQQVRRSPVASAVMGRLALLPPPQAPVKKAPGRPARERPARERPARDPERAARAAERRAAAGRRKEEAPSEGESAGGEK